MEAASGATRTTMSTSPSPYFPTPSLLGLGGLGLLASGLGSVGMGMPGHHAHYANSLISRESSRDDLASMLGDGQIFEYEERFRVDRRKLELLMQGRFELIHEPAVDFFGRIGEETNTTVIWPSRLKVGAKSKKDPHIRVGGGEDGVKRAKCLILEFLDTKSTRVTMKMDVSYTDHSHVIGKGGNTIRRVMAETNCHIHFPDSNRNNPNEKSNQVSIAGEMEGVEVARARVRELTPLIFNFDLPIIPSLQAGLPNPEDPFLKAIQDQYNVQIMFRQKQKNFHSTMVVVKGCEWEAARVKEATLMLMQELCCGGVVSGGVMGLSPGEMIVSMTMEISPQHHSIVLGKSNMTLKLIMQKTNTTILFPDAADPNIPSIKKGSVTINGSIHNVYIARQQLIGSLPLVMMFDLPDEVELEDAFVQKLQEDLDVSISIKPKARQSNKSVIIKAQERNASSIYKARSILLSLEEEPIQASIPESYNIHVGSFNNNMATHAGGSFNNLLHAGGFGSSNANSNNNMAPVGSLNSLAGGGSTTGGGGSVSSLGSLLPPVTPSTPWSAGPTPSAAAKQYQAAQQQQQQQSSSFFPFGGPGNALPPNHPFLQDYALLVLNNITRLQQQQQQQQLHDQQTWKLQDPKMKQQSAREENNNLVGSVGKSGPELMHSPPIPGKSPRNSSPMHEDGNLTAALAKLEISQNQHSFANNSNDKASSVQSSGNNSSSGVFCSSNGGKTTTNGSNGGQMLQLLGDRRAPGCEKTILKMAHDLASDYDQKRLLASKAVASKPSSSEVRTPTSAWAGLGFSCSMPEAAIREQLEASKVGPGIRGESLLDDVDEDDEAKRHEQDQEDLPSVFAKQGLAKYTELFLRHEIDLPTFASLNEEDLKEIGIQTFGARKKLMLLANKLKQTLSEKW